MKTQKALEKTAKTYTIGGVEFGNSSYINFMVNQELGTTQALSTKLYDTSRMDEYIKFAKKKSQPAKPQKKQKKDDAIKSLERRMEALEETVRGLNTQVKNINVPRRLFR